MPKPFAAGERFAGQFDDDATVERVTHKRSPIIFDAMMRRCERLPTCQL